MIRHLLLLVSLALVTGLPAQTSQFPHSLPHGVEVDSGLRSNDGPKPATVWSDQVTIPGASSLQLAFGTADLGHPEDFIEVSNPLDGEVMKLTPIVLKQWSNHTAYFNGDTLDVRLVLHPDSTGHVAIETVWAGTPRPSLVGPSPDTQCGTVDNRVPSSDNRVSRMMRNSTTTGGGCTGWLISSTNTVVSAGHCADPFPDFLIVCQFNYPLSTSSGAVQHPPVADQYPVNQESVEWENLGTGDDWAVMRLHPNSTGATAFSRQGAVFTLASSLPTFIPLINVPTIRITGNGADFNNNTRNFAQQTSTGPLTSYGTDVIRYATDSEGGNSGGPVIHNQTGQVIGIHTNGGCTTTGGSNLGQSIFTSDVAAAIDRVRADTNRSMTSGSTYTISAADTTFNYTPSAGNFNVIAVTSTSDWDIETETRPGSNVRASSVSAGSNADVIVANGKAGSLAPIAGRIYRFTGSATARASARSASNYTLGTNVTTTISSSTAVRAYQFNVTSAGTYDISVFGDTSFRWRLVSAGTNSNWRSWGSSLVRSGNVGSSTASGVSLSTGWHCLIITRNGGTVTPSPTDLTINVCAATPAVPLSTTPRTITAACQDFTVTPVANRWSGAIVDGTGTWEMNLGSAQSSTGSSQANWALFNGRNGTASPTWGSVIRTSGTGDATAHEIEPTTILLNRDTQSSVASGLVGRLYEFNVTVAGDYDISVLGDTGLFARVYAPGSAATWIDRGNSIGTSVASGTSFTTKTLGTGWHALVVYTNSGPLTSQRDFTLRVCASTTPLNLNPSSIGTSTTAACVRFDLPGIQSGRYNVVGATGTSIANAITVGSVTSDSAGNDAVYVVQNGHAGAAIGTSGTLNRQSGSGTNYLTLGSTTQINVGSTYNASWGTSTILRAFEFEITSAGSYDITIGPDSTPLWTSAETPWYRFHSPTSRSWEAREDNVGSARSVFSDTTTTRTLAAGWHCIVMYSNNGRRSISDRVLLRVEPTPNPSPVLSSISPSSATAGAANTTITLSGSSFVPGAVVQVNGSNVSTNYVNTGTVTAVIPASSMTVGGTLAVTITNPSPGGGTSASRTFTVNNPRPILNLLSPSSRPVGSSTFTLTVRGSNFNADSDVVFGGATLPTAFISSTTLSATVPSSRLLTVGQVPVTVRNPAPGGGTSPSRTFTVLAPRPVLTSLSPSARIAGTAGFTLVVNGSDFRPNSVIRFGNVNLGTTFLSATQLRASVSASLIEAAGSVAVTVQTPGPGGGSSATRTFTSIAPRITGLVPPVVPVAPPGPGTSVNVIVNGSNFHPGSVVYGNSDPLATSFISATQLLVTINSGAQPVLQVNGGLPLSVSNSDEAFSNFEVLQSGGSNNRGVLSRVPVAPGPGEGYGLLHDGGAAGMPFTLILDFAPVTNTSIYPFIDPVAGYSLNVRPFPPGTPDWFVFFDGIGIHQAPQGFAVFNAQGEFFLAGLTVPNPLVGIDLTAQSVSIDPGAAVGYTTSWVRHADRL